MDFNVDYGEILLDSMPSVWCPVPTQPLSSIGGCCRSPWPFLVTCIGSVSLKSALKTRTKTLFTYFDLGDAIQHCLD